MASSSELQRYLTSAAAVPLLSAAEEVALAQRIEAGRSASRRLAAGAADRDGSLAQDAARGGAAHARFVVANLRLVIRAARRAAAQSGVEFIDLLQDGNVGLVQAVDGYEWRAGCRFSTYAMVIIRQAIQRGAARQQRTVMLPYRTHTALRRLRAASSRLEGELGRAPSVGELAAAADLTPDALHRCRAVDREIVSLDRVLDPGDDGRTLADVLLVDPQDVAEEALDRLAARALRAAVARLDERRRYVVVRHFGLDGRPPGTLLRIAAELRLSRTTVQTALSSALARLRDDLQRPAAAEAA